MYMRSDLAHDSVHSRLRLPGKRRGSAASLPFPGSQHCLIPNSTLMQQRCLHFPSTVPLPHRREGRHAPPVRETLADGPRGELRAHGDTHASVCDTRRDRAWGPPVGVRGATVLRAPDGEHRAVRVVAVRCGPAPRLAVRAGLHRCARLIGGHLTGLASRLGAGTPPHAGAERQRQRAGPPRPTRGARAAHGSLAAALAPRRGRAGQLCGTLRAATRVEL